MSKCISLVTLALLLSACSAGNPSVSPGSDTGTTTMDTETTVSEIPETTPVRRVENCFITAQDQLPSNWPDDIPFYSGSTVTEVKCSPNDSDNFSVRSTSPDNPEQIFTFFSEEVERETWRISSAADAGPYETYNYYKTISADKTGRQLLLDIRRPVGSNLVEIIYRERVF
ncbi:MAG: hypothetical protein TR69_WS6001001152 [candidate division WS6 bacterium OLB20]|uniref:Lipoprotein n=1 Tax=candidate division WS6 bacterium OLB20 TaxID=1617426 RepID=A0A136LWY0_9BACT|nr:MAG: hypothetical protein TR69_WS6001001152 [candidate division WS6 bacterium OLB20]